jgi:formate/nitrite transporter FocA (FNT family)
VLTGGFQDVGAFGYARRVLMDTYRGVYSKQEDGKHGKSTFVPAEIAEKLVESGKKKTGLPAYKLFLLGILAGAFIALAAAGSNAAVHTIESAGIGKALAGAIFSAGLMMVVITGAELFTGNALIIVSCLEKQAGWISLLKNWLIVYTGNFMGAIIIVIFVYLSGQYNLSGGMLGGYTVKIARGERQGFHLLMLFSWDCSATGWYAWRC